MKFWNYLRGKKTYIGLAVAALALVSHKLGFPMPGVQVDDATVMQNLWFLAIAAFARHGYPQIGEILKQLEALSTRMSAIEKR
jgi:hypothetical protein